MKLFSALVLVGLVTSAAACSSSSPTAPTAVVPPSSYTFTASLLPANEVPAVTNAERSGTGTVTIIMNVTRDTAGSITAATAGFSVTLTGFPAGTTLTGAHIHQAAAGATAGVIVNTGLANGEVALTTGSSAFAKTSINVTVDTANNLVANPSGFYFNVHSTTNTGGVARGQLVKQ
ncbi:MAG: CHRD domain-containing protein [Acidobacteria bacterium]|nr:CHRD domain-containing protein [Acidobacteriota bacterium]